MGRTLAANGRVKGYKKKRKSRLSKAIVTVMLLLIALVCVCLFTPVFSIREITVTGTEKLAPEFITDSSGIANGTNLFLADIRRAKRTISQIAYVADVKISRKLPGEILIEVTERKGAALLPFVSGYIVVDQNGKVLEALTDKKDMPLPVIVGTGILKCELGKTVELGSKDQFAAFQSCIAEFINAGLLDRITALDLSNIYEIQAVVENGLYVNYGSDSEFAYKTQYLINVLGHIASPPKGYLDLRTTKSVAYKENYIPEGGSQAN